MFSKADNGFSTERNCLLSVGNAVLCFGKQTNKQTKIVSQIDFQVARLLFQLKNFLMYTKLTVKFNG